MDHHIKKLSCIIISFLLCISLTFSASAESYDSTAKYLLKEVPSPTCDSVGGEWTIVALAESDCDIPSEYFDAYYKNLVEYTKSCNGIISEDSYTEYSRVAIALSAINKSALNVGGYNLANPLKDYERIINQGINGAIYALIALDKGGYIGPRKELREYILSKELPNGGWNFMGAGKADPDMTAMAVQALSHYKAHKNVDVAINRAIDILSNATYDSSESISQVINAYDSLGMQVPSKLTSELLKYRISNGSFKHCLNDDEGNLMSTEQAMIALNKVLE